MMMDAVIGWLQNFTAVTQAAIATSFTWFLTAMGASLVFFFKDIHRKYLDFMLGFTGGVMLAASYWSLLAPSIVLSESLGYPKWVPPAIGFFLGAVFIYMLDKLVPHLHINFDEKKKEGLSTTWHKTTLLILAITLHNIPEGLAVGVAFGAISLGLEGADITGSILLAMGIGIQNFPEGLAVAMPLRREGVSRLKSFWYGQLSAIVEPISGIIGAAAVLFFQPILPFALAFAAGAMIYVVVEEVIPETQQGGFSDLATMGLVIGFIIMMSLDVGLG